MRTVILTRPSTVRDGVMAALEKENVSVLTLPLLEVSAYIDKDFEERLQSEWFNYDGVMLVSQHAVQFAAKRLSVLGLIWRKDVWAAVVGQATAGAVRAAWAEAPLICPDDNQPQDSESLWQAVRRHQPNLVNKRVLIIRAQKGRETFFNHLRDAGVMIDVWSCYRREPLVWTTQQRLSFQQALNQTGVVLSITSQEGLRGFLDNVTHLEERERQVLYTQPVLVLHATIANFARACGFVSVHIAPACDTSSFLLRLVH